MIEATSCGPALSCETRYALVPFGLCDVVVLEETEETVESMEAVRGIIGGPSIGRGSGRDAALEEDIMVGEVGGERCAAAASTGAETFRDWLALGAAFCASSLNASLVTALRIASSSGLFDAFLPGFGALTRSTGSEFAVCMCSWL